MQFYSKIHVVEGKEILAICDKEIQGKTFTQGDKQIQVNDFYKGEIIDEKQLKLILENHKIHIINAIGNNIIDFLSDLKLVDNLITIDNVKIAFILIKSKD